MITQDTHCIQNYNG